MDDGAANVFYPLSFVRSIRFVIFGQRRGSTGVADDRSGIADVGDHQAAAYDHSCGGGASIVISLNFILLDIVGICFDKGIFEGLENVGLEGWVV